MPQRPITVGLLCSLLLLAAGCRGTACCPPRQRTIDYWVLVGQIETGDAEGRYHAILELARFDGDGVRALLEPLLDSDEILTRNAAARVLAGKGDERAVGVLIANLDRDNRTWAVTDAIYHLRALYGTNRGYEPNRGYRHQTEAQAAWVQWHEESTRLLVAAGARPDREKYEALFARLEPEVEAYIASETEDRDALWTATQALWQALAGLHKSREPRHVALAAHAFGEMTTRWPTIADLANNHALAALNDGRYEDALASYDRALALAPDEACFHNDRGILLEALGRFDEAAASYRRAIELAPEDSVWWSNLGDTLRALDRKEEAIAAYRRAEKLEPEKWYYHRLWIKRLGTR